MYAKVANITQKQLLVGKITALAQHLQQLAPHPDRPGYKGPLFVKSNPNARIANERDGMLGAMMLEAMIGPAFSEALSDTCGEWTENIDFAATMECYSEYITDIAGKQNEPSEQHKRAHGQGTMARMSGKSIANSFNLRGSISAGMQSFLDDLPARLKVEKELAYYLRQLEMLDAPAPVYAPKAPAPAPKFAA
ncbi:MAG: hypothetical protein IPH06_10370 [Alphaproteobacteria bacterium]|nr:hypothetical protein [Alphaproteobacteria bacterium]QQS58389.1 MAG: hypothetical protein IPN28_06125 [Alphaproteobacteria bacterium]